MSPAQLDEAQEKLQALVDDKVPPARLMMLRQGLVQQQLSAGRMQDALGHLLANIEFFRAEGKTAPEKAVQPLLMNLNLASNVLREMGKVEEVAPLWRAALADADSAKATDPAGKSLVSDLRRGWVSKLLDNGAPFDEA
ncbi:MAG: hypothetical protein ACKOJF_12155, partial [Planctomycetaceae bacterium]